MTFSSVTFLFYFLPILIIAYYLIAEKYRNALLLIASLFFYSWGEPKTILLMCCSIVINYYLALGMDKYVKIKKALLVIAVCYNLGCLFVFKYFNFVVDIINKAAKANLTIVEIALPIGISFYTFQVLSYIIDVYRGEVQVQRKFVNLALYISLFPQLVAGPIVRYSTINEQIDHRTVQIESFRRGLVRFTHGFSKKVLLADQLGLLVDNVWSGKTPSVWLNWIGMVAYTLQIYYDFSGYSDMAIGMGQMFGFSFDENFNYPYISKSVQEFWRRWHISLGSWFRDYLYIPLGGSRKGIGRTYINLLIVFFLTGLWHGAGYNFIVWGLYYAFFMICERAWLAKKLEKTPKLLRHIYVIIVVMVGWVFFRGDNLTQSVMYLRGLFVSGGNDMGNLLRLMDGRYWFVLLCGVVLSCPYDKIKAKLTSTEFALFISDIASVIIFLIAICYMLGSGYSPFLYFRF